MSESLGIELSFGCRCMGDNIVIHPHHSIAFADLQGFRGELKFFDMDGISFPFRLLTALRRDSCTQRKDGQKQSGDKSYDPHFRFSVRGLGVLP